MYNDSNIALLKPVARQGFAGFYDLTYGASTPEEQLQLMSSCGVDGEIGGSVLRAGYEVWDEDRLIGFMDVESEGPCPTMVRHRYWGSARVIGVYVHPSYQKQGVARSLMELLADRLLSKAVTLHEANASTSVFDIEIKIEGEPGVPAMWRMVDALQRQLGHARQYCEQYLGLDFRYAIDEPETALEAA